MTVLKKEEIEMRIFKRRDSDPSDPQLTGLRFDQVGCHIKEAKYTISSYKSLFMAFYSRNIMINPISGYVLKTFLKEREQISR